MAKLGRVVITGGTGFIGRVLTDALIATGYHVVATGTGPQTQQSSDGITLVSWDGRDPDALVPYLDGAAAVVHLAGEPILGRWTAAKKDRILRTRIESGSALASAIRKTSKRPKVLIQASAIGYYGNTHDEIITEAHVPGNEFLSFVCAQWEGSTESVERLGIRRCVVRLAPVIGPGGFIAQRAKAFQWFVGGPVGDGTQWVSAVHRDDVLRAILFLIDNHACTGVFNLTAPEPAREAAVAKSLGQALHRPSWVSAPRWALRLRYGDLADEVLLTSQRVHPAKLLAAGFQFTYQTVVEGITAVRSRAPK